jgi:hypothetical protein
MAKSYSLSNSWLKISLCFCVVPFIEFWSILIIKAYHYIYIQQQHISFWAYLSLYSSRWFLFNLIPLILCFFVGFLINFFASTSNKFSWRFVFVLAIVLIGIEQLAQFIVANDHGAINIPIIEGWLRIAPLPVVNDSEYYIPTKITNQLFLLLFYPCMTFILYFAYRCCYFFMPKQRCLLAISAGLYASVISCAFLNSLFYNHGYDYIEIEYMIVLNFMDVCLNLWRSTVFLLFAEAIPYLKQAKSFKPRIAEYLKWERTTWIATLNRLKLFLQKRLKAAKKG